MSVRNWPFSATGLSNLRVRYVPEAEVNLNNLNVGYGVPEAEVDVDILNVGLWES